MKPTVKQLEAKIAELEKRIAALEARPYWNSPLYQKPCDLPHYPSPAPLQTDSWPPYKIFWCGVNAAAGASLPYTIRLGDWQRHDDRYTCPVTFNLTSGSYGKP